jgi:CheY-like chemotaxis protein
MISEDLHGSGYQVDTAIDGESGLRRLRQNHYDATLCDWKMPGLNGRQVYEQLRATNPGLCRRLIFITGDVINEPMRQFLESEKRPCLAKPFTFAEFHATLKAVLANQ